MKKITQFEYERSKENISAIYYPESENEDSGYIKLSREGIVIEERRSKFDKTGEYHETAKTHLNCMWGMSPLPKLSIIQFD